jgi:hypothetical protein
MKGRQVDTIINGMTWYSSVLVCRLRRRAFRTGGGCHICHPLVQGVASRVRRRHFDELGFVCVYVNVLTRRRWRSVNYFGNVHWLLRKIVGECNLPKFRIGNLELIIRPSK